MKKQTLWNRDFTLLILASTFGSIGGIAGSYAMSFLVYDETGSTLAAGLLIAMRIIPQFLLPILIAPWMDRLPRKPFLVWGDLAAGVLYGMAGLYLQRFEFRYIGYLIFSLILTSIGSVDALAFNSIFPQAIPEGFEQKGYTVSGMLYPVLNVLMMPLAAVLMDTIGVANILLLQCGMSILAAVAENQIKITETRDNHREKFGISMWWRDLKEGFLYLKRERGLLSIYSYMAVTNGAAMGYGPILVAFFRTTPGFSAAMYSFFTVAEFLGRSLGGLLHYHIVIPKKRRFGFTFLVYQVYELMDMTLLWIPYPAMLVNRGICGFLGINSATLRDTAVQQYLPEEYRARVNAFEGVVISGMGGVFALIVGAIGEMIPLRLTMTITGGLTFLSCWFIMWLNRKSVAKVYCTEA